MCSLYLVKRTLTWWRGEPVESSHGLDFTQSWLKKKLERTSSCSRPQRSTWTYKDDVPDRIRMTGGEAGAQCGCDHSCGVTWPTYRPNLLTEVLVKSAKLHRRYESSLNEVWLNLPHGTYTPHCTAFHSCVDTYCAKVACLLHFCHSYQQPIKTQKSYLSLQLSLIEIIFCFESNVLWGDC